MQWIKPFGEISKHDAGTAGGKGASLGEMTQAGIPVPPGYVLLAQSFDAFVEQTGLESEIASILSTVHTEDNKSVDEASQKIQSLILSKEVPAEMSEEILSKFDALQSEFVAVRSSATAEDSSAAAWAGQLDTYLNTTRDTLLTNVRRCWASLFTPRAVFYRFEKGLHGTKISVAVVVQKMVNSEAAGVAFSVDPVTEDRNQVIIEGAFGLGEAVVSGQVTPDSYAVTKIPVEIVNKDVAAKDRGIFRKDGGGNEWRDLTPEEGGRQALNDAEIRELTKTVMGIEKHYGFPVDVEWAKEGGKIYITQSRPITTLKS